MLLSSNSKQRGDKNVGSHVVLPIQGPFSHPATFINVCIYFAIGCFRKLCFGQSLAISDTRNIKSAHIRGPLLQSLPLNKFIRQIVGLLLIVCARASYGAAQNLIAPVAGCAASHICIGNSAADLCRAAERRHPWSKVSPRRNWPG